MSTRRFVLGCMAWLAIGALAAPAAAAPGAAGDPVRVRRDPADDHWALGNVAVATDAAAVWERLQRVEAWRDIFSDISELHVRGREGARWNIHLNTRAMTCGPHDYKVTLDAARRTAEVRIQAPGVDSRAVMAVAARAEGGARVDYKLYVKARGIMGWFVSKRKLREMQEQMVATYLRDFRRAFQPAAK